MAWFQRNRNPFYYTPTWRIAIAPTLVIILGILIGVLVGRWMR